ncbi:unnamed protein product [Euphydryas editha]|nr:unnamed protein product [Euphydryas editha]
MDDLIVISASFEQHLQDLRAVFDRLRVFCLRANRAKCVFARDRVKYLGDIITPQGVSPDPDKVAAIAEMKEPTSMKHLKSFLQTCSWFRKFVPNFSKVAQPLTLLTKKKQPWKWDKAQSEAFAELKILLTSAPILRQPDYNLPFVLRTDASNYALGAVLLQGESPSEERPIEYASRLLTSAERNYSTTEREALAVVWAAEKFRGYIDGHQVCIASDHQPLRWLLTLKSPTGRLVRWAMKLQSLNLNVDYTPGKANVIADTLSRPPCDDDARDTCGLCTVVVEMPRWDATTLREDQLADPEIAKIINDIEGKEEVALKRWTERGYYTCKGVLYRYADVESEEPQLIVPENLRKTIVSECYDTATSGHGGIERTLHRISQRYYFADLQIAILVKNEHHQWPEVLPFIRFSLNTSLTSSTGQTPAYLTYGRELRSPITAQSDLRSIVEAENYVPQITTYLLKLADTLSTAKERIEHEQDTSKVVKDKTRQVAEVYEPGDLVLLKTHVLSNASKGVSSKFIPKRDGPYCVTKKVSPTTYMLSHCEPPGEVIGKYHTADFRRYHARSESDHVVPLAPKRKRVRPRKT